MVPCKYRDESYERELAALCLLLNYAHTFHSRARAQHGARTTELHLSSSVYSELALRPLPAANSNCKYATAVRDSPSQIAWLQGVAWKAGHVSHISFLLGAACKVDKVTNPPYSRCKASSVWNNDKIGVSHGTGRLDSVQAWSARTNAKGQWWQMDLGATKTVGGVRTKGRHGGTDNQRVTAYKVCMDMCLDTCIDVRIDLARHMHRLCVHKVSTSLDGSTWTVVDGDKVFSANVANSNSEIKTRFSKPVTARYVRIIVESWRHHVSMRAAVDVCGNPPVHPYLLNGSWSMTAGQSMHVDVLCRHDHAFCS